jgi:hypothetical protein
MAFAYTLTPAPGCAVEETLEQEQSVWYPSSPWIDMPEDGVPFDEVRFIDTPAANGVETVIFTAQLPTGYRGVIKYYHHHFQGPGFNEGSGDLIWRIRQGPPGTAGRTVRNFGDMRSTRGSLQQPRIIPGGILLDLNDFMTYTVTHAVGSPIIPGGTRIFATLSGWFWPIRRR